MADGCAKGVVASAETLGEGVGEGVVAVVEMTALSFASFTLIVGEE